MKTVFITIFLLILTCTDWKTQSSDNKRISELLTNVEQKNKSINSVSYYSTYEQINPTVKDSVFKVVGKVWLKPDKKDSIFSSVFHLKGRDGGGLFDYYYDGSKSYEIRHENKAIKIFDPYKYENNPNNPAKARTALSPLIPELTDTNLSETLKKNNPIVNIIVNKDSYNIGFKYPVNEYGQELALHIYINKKTYLIGKIQKNTTWRGVEYKTSIVIDSLLINDLDSTNNLFLQSTYSDYAVTEFEPGSNQQLTSGFIGLKAKDFKYPANSNDSVRLKSLTGKFVLLDFWETWCGHCIVALPEIQKIQDKYHNDLVVLGITTENKPQVVKLLQNNKLTYINVFADQQIINDYSLQGRPTYFLLDRNGTIIDHTEGNLEKIITDLKELLK
jgi:thiol-disulfide isomerase/thioredoxin